MNPTQKKLISKIPKDILSVIQTLENAGFEAYLVGGCVRDLLMIELKEPKDWDVTTNAKPEQIIKLFDKTIYENNFGTVIVCVPHETTAKESIQLGANKIENGDLRQIEVTPYRIEAKYTDFRHPDEVKFSDRLEDDLKRRDFTVNAIALGADGNLVDLFDGIKDIKDKVLRAVGDADDRFREDALRMLRAVRFACELGFSISHETTESILKNSTLLEKISAERIRDEFVKIIMSSSPGSGMVMLERLGLLREMIPELEEGIGCDQSGGHIYDVWNHLLHAVQHAADKNLPLEIRLSALFHDIGKPRSRRDTHPGQQNSVAPPASGVPREQNFADRDAESQRKKNYADGRVRPKGGGMSNNSSFAGDSAKKKYTFYGHEVVGARMSKKIMERLKFPRKDTELVEKLVRNHMFFSDTELITLSAVRRIITKVGKENIWPLMEVRECDRVGMKKKEAPYRLRKYFAMIEEALRDPISVGQLKINGEYMIKELGIAPGPRMGWILHALLEEVLDAPEKNTVEHLSELVKSLNMLGDEELRTMGERGKEKKEELEEEEIAKLHAKHGV